MKKYNHQLQNYTFKTTKIKKEVTIESILTFDIEVSSGWLENGKVIGYTKGKSAEYWNELIPLALCYIWQFSCDGEVYYGRELRDFIQVLNDLPKKEKMIIWVHNLAYEFQFLCNILHWKEVFARTPHKPMKAVPKEYPNIEFRCTYILTRLSLKDWGMQLGLPKLVGDLDYEILRTPLTKLTEIEMEYCERDCLVVEAGIKTYIEKYGRQCDIPLTQTGTVRREVKQRLQSNRKYNSFIKKLVPRNAREYKMLQAIFAGGYTHANRWYAGEVVRGIIEHYDFASSYPTVMIAEKYPMSKWVYTGEHEFDESKFNDYAYIALVKFSKLNVTSFNTYIQASKAHVIHGEYDNGRVMKADELTMWITEQDYLTIKNTYKWCDMEIVKLYESRKEYLPRAFTDYILDLYANKTELKDVEGMEDLYLQSKQYINAMFGMCVTAIVQADVILENDVWKMSSLTEEYVNEKLKELSDKNPRERKYFLSYSWGCWVTAYARRNLWKCIETVDDDLLYCDTDSIFVVGHHDFTWYNEEITQKLKKACSIMNLDFNKTRPKTPKGKEKPLGIFASEDDCTEFITLGAKRYVERRKSDGQLHLTVSGINKGAVDLLNDNIENFKDGFDFDKDSESVSKRLSTYIYEMPVVRWNDGYTSTYQYGINMRRTGYKLTMTDEYKNLIDYMDKDVLEVLNEQYLTSARGRFSLLND